MKLNKLVRESIAALKPYSSARDEFSGEAMVFLDANENPYNEPYNRYPDPHHKALKDRIALLKGTGPEQIFLGNGSDEPIDLLIRAFCEPGKHNIVMMTPTYGMYEVAAGINNIETIKVQLSPEFQLNAASMLAAATKESRLMFLCSPNNPTGNLLDTDEIVSLIKRFEGIVVVDEAYIDFAPGRSLLPKLSLYDNLVVLQTFSKAWGMAGLRLGMAFGSPEIIAVLNKIKYPYNLNMLTQEVALRRLDYAAEVDKWVSLLIEERNRMATALAEINGVERVFPSDANFLLVRVKQARKIYDQLLHKGIVVRDRSSVVLCQDSLRITVGTPAENILLLEALAASIDNSITTKP